MAMMGHGHLSPFRSALRHKQFEYSHPRLALLCGLWYRRAAALPTLRIAPICVAASLTRQCRRHGSRKASTTCLWQRKRYGASQATESLVWTTLSCRIREVKGLSSTTPCLLALPPRTSSSGTLDSRHGASILPTSTNRR